MLSSLLFLAPAVYALAPLPSCVVKTVSVTKTVTVDPVKSVTWTTEKPKESPTWAYTYTSLKTCSKGETITWDGTVTVLKTETVWPVVTTKKWSDPSEWGTWTECYTTYTTVTKNGKPTTEECTKTITHTGAPKVTSSKPASKPASKSASKSKEAKLSSSGKKDPVKGSKTSSGVAKTTSKPVGASSFPTLSFHGAFTNSSSIATKTSSFLHTR